jgi:hypothetical protein
MLESYPLLYSDWLQPLFGIVLAIVLITVFAIVIKDRLSNPVQYTRPDDYDVLPTVVRRGWTVDEKEQVRIRQDGKCAHCGKPPPRWDYHHVDGDRSNNSMSNCEGLCPNCHSVETHE